MRVILLGAPGAGKGTQAELLAKNLGIPKLSTGDMTRSEIALCTELGNQIKDLTNSGHLVPDDIIIKILKNRLNNKDCTGGFILDGFPRTVNQAEELAKIFANMPPMQTSVIAFNVGESLLLQRLTGRYTCKTCGAGYNIHYIKPKIHGVCDRCGGTDFIHRKDDDEESVKIRLKVYKEITEPLIDYYREKGMLFEVDGAKSVEDLRKDIESIIKRQGIGKELEASA